MIEKLKYKIIEKQRLLDQHKYCRLIDKNTLDECQAEEVFLVFTSRDFPPQVV